jgi:hypothetical protein
MESAEQAIKRFLADISCLDELEEMLGASNLFDVLGMARAEIRHSNVLRWLLDPKGSHGLGGLFLRTFLQRLSQDGADAIQLLSGDLSAFTVEREYKHIDVLLLSREAQVVVAIENKVDSGEHDNQLKRYEQTLMRDFPGYYQEMICLSPNGVVPSESRWRVMTYEVILSALKYCMQRVSLSNESSVFLSQYVQLLEREFMNKEKLSEICNRIYREHKQALDQIYEMREDSCRVVFNMIVDWATRHPESLLKCDIEHSNKTYIRITTETLMKLVPPLKEGKKSAWGSDKSIYYELVNRAEGLSLKLTVSAKNLEPTSLDSLCHVFGLEKSSLSKNWQWKTIKSLPVKRKIDPNEEQSLDQEQVDAFMKAVEDGVAKFESTLSL